jgi:CheY-like chemotaxis protein
LIDDEKDFLINLQELLEIYGYETNIAFNGLEGLEKLSKADFNIVICDMSMPHMTGLQFLEEMKKHENFKSVPVVILSAHLADEEKEVLKNTGAAACIQKGIPFNKINETIQKLIL